MWQVKAATDSAKSLLPLQQLLRRAKRRIVPYVSNVENDIHLLGDALRQIKALHRWTRVYRTTVVEIGTGWRPILPMVYRLCGADRVITLDQERLTDFSQVQSTIRFVFDRLEETSKRLNIGDFTYHSIPTHCSSLTNFLKEARIDYRAPDNFLSLPSSCADIIASRDVLEHIPTKALREIARHSYSVLRPGGMICHTIDMSDHWEHVDKSISKVNFLKYDGPLWEAAGLNPQNYQNRLRRYEYIDIFKDAGFRILEASGEAHAESLAALPGLKLSGRYKNIAHDELAIISTTIIARRGPA